MQYDFFMGLAAASAMPVIAAVALACAPLAAQSRPPEANPKRLIEKADRLAWLYNWYLPGLCLQINPNQAAECRSET